ncbi:unnamed protein product, partial [marine sediment metagenome]
GTNDGLKKELQEIRLLFQRKSQNQGVTFMAA